MSKTNLPIEDLKENPWPNKEDGGAKAQIALWREEIAGGEQYEGESAEFEAYVSENYPEETNA